MKLVAVLITLALVYYAFFIVLPSEISWAEVESALKALTAAEIAALVVSGLILMVVLGWAAKASLPGLTLFQGFESSATSQMTAFVVPPPGDYVIRFAMYRTYGFSDEQSGASVLVSMVLRYVAIFFMPIIGLLAVIVAGTATSTPGLVVRRPHHRVRDRLLADAPGHPERRSGTQHRPTDQLSRRLGDGPVPSHAGRRHRAQRRQLRPTHTRDGEQPTARP